MISFGRKLLCYVMGRSETGPSGSLFPPRLNLKSLCSLEYTKSSYLIA